MTAYNCTLRSTELHLFTYCNIIIYLQSVLCKHKPIINHIRLNTLVTISSINTLYKCHLKQLLSTNYIHVQILHELHLNIVYYTTALYTTHSTTLSLQQELFSTAIHALSNGNYALTNTPDFQITPGPSIYMSQDNARLTKLITRSKHTT